MIDVAEVDICNQSLSHLGIAVEIQNLDTDKSASAQACRRFYEQARDECLRAFAWPFATKFEDLALVEEDPTDEWGFSYRYPANAINVRRILSQVARNEASDQKVPYKLVRDDDGLLIYTDMEDAVIEYTYAETETARFTPDFANAVSFLLAFKMAPRLTKGDQFKLGNRAFQMYQFAIGEARAMALNEEQPDQPPDSEFIRARN